MKKHGKMKKLSFLLLLMFLSCLSTYAQEQLVTVNLKNVSLKEVLSAIEKQTTYRISYRNAVIDGRRDITISKSKSPVSAILDEAFAGRDLEYSMMSPKSIVVTDKQKDSAPTGAHKKITGTIKDATGEAVIGANVMVKGTSIGSITDVEGRFGFDAPANGTIVVSYIGYLGQEIPINGRQTFSILLKEDTKTLDEVVVVGYGTQKKVNLTGSVTSISAEEIADRVQPDVLAAVQGTVPGVTIISRPGSTPSINFRGRGNLGTSSPLYVIDGAIADASFFSNLDASSIESISFLKDAASSAIYGSRAAYGVVLVTTKTGKKDKLNVSYNGMIGLDMPTYIPETVDSWQYAEMLNEGFYNRNSSKGKYQVYSEEEIGWFKDGSKPDYYPNTNWFDLILDKKVVTTKHALNFSGGSDKMRYFAGLGYLYTDKFIPGQSSDRYNLNLTIASDVTKWLTLKAGVKYIRNSSESKNGSPYLVQAISIPGVMVAKQSNGEWGTMAGGKQAQQTWLQGNPLRKLSRDDWSKGKTENTMYDLGFDLKPIKGLVISGQAVFKGYEYKSKSYTALQDNVKNFETGAEIPGTGTTINSMSMSWSSSTQMLYTGTAKYDFEIEKHAVSVLVGTSYEHYNYEALSGSRKNFPIDGMQDMGAGSSAGTDISNGAGMSENKMMSYFGRVNYAFNDRYLFEGNLRADASSRFYKKNRWGYFPSASVGWRISEEAFMKNVDWISNLKLRASLGTLGNINNVGNYDYFQNYNSESNYTFNNQAVQGILESKPANTGLGWETVSLTDFGVDWDLFNHTLSISADYYIKKTSDILLGYNVPVEAGIGSAPSQNIGKVENKGFEFSLNYRNSIGGVDYAIGGNIATNNNAIVNLGSSNNIIQNGGDKVRYILTEGESIGSYYGYKTDGLYTQEEIDRGHFYTFGRKPNAGDVKYVPQREGVEWGSGISGEDRTILGKDVPDFTYGVNLSVAYKGFELSLFGQGVSGTKVGFEADQVTPFTTGNNPKKFHLGRWTQENPNPYAASPRLYGGNSLDDYNNYFSDLNLFSADYFRIKTITLGYVVPASKISRTGITSLKFFLTSENLFTIRGDRKMKDFDPEDATGRGLGAFGTKSVAFGVNLSF